MDRYIGLDLGLRSKHCAAVLDGPNLRGKPFSVQVSREGFDELLRRGTEGAKGPVKFVLEPTGLAWIPLAAYMQASGHQVYLTKAKKASDLRKFLRQHTKTDPVDAETNARLPQVDPRGAHQLRLPTAEQMTLRRLVMRRERWIQQAADGKRRIHALMVMTNPPLMSALGGAAFGQGALAFYRRYADPQKVVNLGLLRLRKFWQKHSKGQADPELADRAFKACQTTAELYSELRRTGQLPFDYAAIQDELRTEIDEIERAEQEAQHLDGSIAEIYRRLDPDRTLETIQGIAEVIAPALEVLIGNVERFRNISAFVSYSGLCPRKKQSGQSDPPMPITKAGQRLLKKYFYLAAETARQWDPDFAAYYARRYARGDDHNRIMIALARKMAMCVYALLKRREQARRTKAQALPAEPVRYLLRNPETGAVMDKKHARTLILEKYTRARVDPVRHQRDRRRRGKTEEPGPAKVEWPSKDATNGKPAPPSRQPIAQPEIERNHSAAMETRGGDWVSIAEILGAMLDETAVEKLEEYRWKKLGQLTASLKKNA